MKNTEIAELITAISQALALNKELGTYQALEKEGINKLLELIKKIDVNKES